MYGHKISSKSGSNRPTVGSLFSGIGGFDIGFRAAGFRIAWQVEIDPICRAVLAAHFPGTQRFGDVRECGAHNLSRVDIIVGGFPCQDVSTFGKHRGLRGARSGLFFEAARIVTELRPKWVVFENVQGLLSSNDGADFQTIICTLAECGYVGLWRVLDAAYFGVAARRRRVFVVGGLGVMPPGELLGDAAPMDPVLGSNATASRRPLAEWRYPAVLAGIGNSTLGFGGSGLVAVERGRREMVERGRAAKANGLCLGLDAANATEARGAGNAVVPQVAEWVARHLRAAL